MCVSQFILCSIVLGNHKKHWKFHMKSWCKINSILLFVVSLSLSQIDSFFSSKLDMRYLGEKQIIQKKRCDHADISISVDFQLIWIHYLNITGNECMRKTVIFFAFHHTFTYVFTNNYNFFSVSDWQFNLRLYSCFHQFFSVFFESFHA